MAPSTRWHRPWLLAPFGHGYPETGASGGQGTVKSTVAERQRCEYRVAMTTPRDPRYVGYRFPAEVITIAVWLYFRFPLSLRMVEEMLWRPAASP